MDVETPALPLLPTDDAITQARAQLAAGDAAAALGTATERLSEPHLSSPPSAETAATRGLLLLERTYALEALGRIPEADEAALGAAQAFRVAGLAHGQALAELALGDLAWRAGQPEVAATRWSVARAGAEAIGALTLAARALLSLATLEMRWGHPAEAEGVLALALERIEAARAAQRGGAAAPEEIALLEVGRCLLEVRRALAASQAEEARLLLRGAGRAAIEAGDPAPGGEAPRPEASLARREGRGADVIGALETAVALGRQAGDARVTALAGAEYVMALAEWGTVEAATEAAELLAPVGSVRDEPAVHAAWLEATGLVALRSGDAETAGARLERAFETRMVVRDEAGAARTELRLAEVALRSGRSAAALAFATTAGERATLAADAPTAVSARLIAARALLVAGRSDAPRACAEARAATEGAAALGARGLQAVAADLWAEAALVAGSAGDASAAIAALRAASGASGSAILRSRAEARAAHVALALGDLPAALDAAMASTRAAVEAPDSLDSGAEVDLETRARALLVAGVALDRLTRVDEAVVGLAEARDLALRCGREDLAAEASFALGSARRHAGEREAAEGAFLDASELAERASLLGMSARAWHAVGVVRREREDLSGSLEALDRAAVATRRAGSATEGARISVDAAQGWLQARETAKAEALLEALGPIDASNPPFADPDLRAMAASVRARALLQRGRIDEALHDAQHATAWHREGRDRRGLGAALFLEGQIQAIRGHGQPAGAALAEAYLIAAELGLPEIGLIRAAIERLTGEKVP